MNAAGARLRRITLTLAFCNCFGVTAARAEMAVLLEEPYGFFGSLNPTGHAALYFSNICADSPHELRRCTAGEIGVVISRYGGVGNYDWLAMPLIPYLYAVDRLEDVPLFASEKSVSDLRETYRKKALYELVPDGDAVKSPDGGWTQLVGVSYIRKIYSFKIDTTEEQDDRLIERLNSHDNRSHFNLFFNNCADFARTVIDFYFPRLVRRNFLADAGLTTPKQVAKSVVKYARKHPDLHLSCFVIPQIRGDAPRSYRNRGIFESLVLTKKYAVPLVVLHPFITAALAVGYLTGGRFDFRGQISQEASTEWQPARIVARFQPDVAQNTRAAVKLKIPLETIASTGGYEP